MKRPDPRISDEGPDAAIHRAEARHERRRRRSRFIYGLVDRGVLVVLLAAAVFLVIAFVRLVYPYIADPWSAF